MWGNNPHQHCRMSCDLTSNSIKHRNKKNSLDGYMFTSETASK